MKVILDTNVIIAAFASRGLCESVFELCLDNHEILVSNEILGETKEKLTKKLKLRKEHVQQIISLLSIHSTKHLPVPLSGSECRDSKDIHVLGLIASSDADILVTGDKDLLVLGKFRNTPIVTPRWFYDIIKSLNE